MSSYTESEERSSDTEITLGMRSILGIFFGLALICGVFFGFGYSLGRGNAAKATAPAQIAPDAQADAPPSPVKTVVEGASSPSLDAYTYMPGPGGPTRKPAAAAPQPKLSASAVAPPATPAADQTPQPTNISYTTPAPAKAAPAAAPPAASIMVQIAAVSRPEDAEVLVSALKKLGYNASVRSESSDQLLHVQIGPFSTRDQAKSMRARLVNDGYNAILK